MTLSMLGLVCTCTWPVLCIVNFPREFSLHYACFMISPDNLLMLTLEYCSTSLISCLNMAMYVYIIS